MSAVPYRRTFVRLLGFLRPYKRSLIVSTVLAVGSQAAAIGIVVLVQQAIDGIEERRGTGTLTWIVVAILVVGIVKALLMAGRRLISGRQALGIGSLTEAIGKSYTRGDAIVIPLPHPSGASGWLNDQANRARLGKALTHVRREILRLGSNT